MRQKAGSRGEGAFDPPVLGHHSEGFLPGGPQSLVCPSEVLCAKRAGEGLLHFIAVISLRASSLSAHN